MSVDNRTACSKSIVGVGVDNHNHFTRFRTKKRKAIILNNENEDEDNIATATVITAATSISDTVYTSNTNTDQLTSSSKAVEEDIIMSEPEEENNNNNKDEDNHPYKALYSPLRFFASIAAGEAEEQTEETTDDDNDKEDDHDVNDDANDDADIDDDNNEHDTAKMYIPNYPEQQNQVQFDHNEDDNNSGNNYNNNKNNDTNNRNRNSNNNNPSFTKRTEKGEEAEKDTIDITTAAPGIQYNNEISKQNNCHGSNKSNGNSNALYVYGDDNRIKENTLIFPNNTGECRNSAEAAIAIAVAGRGEELLLVEMVRATAVIEEAKSQLWHRNAAKTSINAMIENAIRMNPLLPQVTILSKLPLPPPSPPQPKAPPSLLSSPPSKRLQEQDHSSPSNPDNIDDGGIIFAVDDSDYDDKEKEPRKKRLKKGNISSIMKKTKSTDRITCHTPIKTLKKTTMTTTTPKKKNTPDDPQERKIQNDTQWKGNYDQLVLYYREHGNSNVLRSDPNKKLSGWVKRQRNNFKDGKLNYQKILALNALDFIWNRIESAWYEKYAQLCKYQETYGHCNVVSIIDRTLAEWTQRQRREYRRLNGTSLTMTQTRIHALEKVPNWGWGKTKDDRPSFGTSDECDSSS